MTSPSAHPPARELSLTGTLGVMTICGVLWELESESGEPVSAPALLATLSVSILATREHGKDGRGNGGRGKGRGRGEMG